MNALQKANLDVAITDEALLIVGDGDYPTGVRLNRDPEVQAVARGLAEGTDFADGLSRCNARFEVGPRLANNEAAILQVESILQKLTEGFVYQTWDQRLFDAK